MTNREMLFTALGSETRLRMLELIAAHKEMCGCELVDHFEVAQSAVSTHLHKLRAAGLVKDRRDGFRVFYRIVPEVMDEAFEQLRASMAKHIEQGRGQDPEGRVEKRLAQKTLA